MDSISVEFVTVPTTASMFDAVSYNFSFYLYPGNYSSQLLNKESPQFKQTAYRFCQDIDKMFENVGLRSVRKRYYGCVVDSFGQDGEVKFRVLLQGVEVVRPSSMFNIFAYSGDQVPLDGIFYLPFGNIYVAVFADPSYSLTMLSEFVTHPYPFSTTTPQILYTVFTISLEVFEPQWSKDLEDVTSLRYRALVEPFCADISSWLSRWSTDYIRCDDVKFSKDPTKITADLTFKGLQDSSLERDIDTIIKETAEMIPMSNLYVREIGTVLIYDKSLVLSQRTVSAGNTTVSTPVTTPTITTSTTTRSTTPLEPCTGVPDNTLVPHPTRCDLFYQCYSGFAVPIECLVGKVFLGTTCVNEPPGFLCDKSLQ